MINEILYGKEAREAIKKGVDKVADAVKVTLGPAGRCVVISRAFMSPNGLVTPDNHVTKDGVTVAHAVELYGLDRVGAKFVKEAAQKTMNEVGDGTTTTSVLLQALVEEGLKLVEAGANPVQLKKDIEQMVVDVVKQLADLAIPVDGDIEKIRQVATISANNDAVIGNLIAEAFEKIGSDGVITIEESLTAKTYVEVKQGFEFNNGWLSTYFINDGAKNRCELKDVQVLLYSKKITKMSQFGKWIEEAFQKPLLIICDDMEGEALGTFTMNNRRHPMEQKPLTVCVVKAPAYGDKRREMMEDIAALTGATYISDENGTSLEKAGIKALGRCEKVVVTKDSCVIIGGTGETEALLNDLRMTETEVVGAEKEAIQARIAKLTGGVAVLHVGAATETEMKEKKDRADDAVRATKAAVAEGIVPGAGTAYMLAVKEMARNGSFQPGISDVMYRPLEQICANGGVDNVPVYNALFASTNPYFGYNAKTGKIENLIEAGIIDPVKVLRCALQNAASAAVMILTSETLIADNV